ncbi:uncharacterized protein LOC114743057 [Neltuma alba]|uniref:uncharacterized protein LOC114743057 n=1 Tax=Neltuma alba TaxID=207710 RepID=UPI0010A2C93F|nr:uncharacterized protein LOC114743057 [Prosopis alba]
MHEEEFILLNHAVEVIRSYISNYQQKWDGNSLEVIRSTTIMVTWEAPQSGRCKLNVDGRVSCDGIAGCGGGIRGDYEEWLSSFSVRLNNYSSVKAETWAVLEGLILCLDRGFKKVKVETDVAQITRAMLFNDPVIGNVQLFTRIRMMLEKKWQV